MSALKNISEDWSCYASKKKSWEDKSFLSVEQAWEIDYLIGKTKKPYPYVSEEEIRDAFTNVIGFLIS